MPKKLRKYLANAARVVICLVVITGMFEGFGESIAGDYYGLVMWGLRALLFVVICVIGWRNYTGVYRDCDLLVDD